MAFRRAGSSDAPDAGWQADRATLSAASRSARRRVGRSMAGLDEGRVQRGNVAQYADAANAFRVPKRGQGVVRVGGRHFALRLQWLRRAVVRAVHLHCRFLYPTCVGGMPLDTAAGRIRGGLVHKLVKYSVLPVAALAVACGRGKSNDK